MESLFKFLSPLRVQLEQLLLDPNNPRFAELGDDVSDPIPEGRFADERVQKDTVQKMRSDKFDVAELRDTMKTIGFLPMDKIVVREWKANPEPGNPRFVVIEGNRRVTALKWLIELHETGRETFSTEQLENFQNLEVLILDQDAAPDAAVWILPGLRHVSGVKEWGPYQKARAVAILRDTGASPQDSAQSLGLSVRAANQLYRSYLALQQMKKDDEFGDHADPRLYSYFEEIFKKADVRDWLGWDDTEKRFNNMGHLREMYTWILGEPNEFGELSDPKLPEAKSIRDLSPILNDEAALAEFRSENGSLTRALARYEADHPEDWQPVVVKAESVLSNLSPDILRGFTPLEIQNLERLVFRIQSVLSDREKLTT